MTRTNNNIIQLHFCDLTSLAINREDERGIYFINKRGNQIEVNYNQCKNAKLKTKVRRFSNLIQKLSAQNEDESDVEEEELDEEDESPEASYGSQSH